MTEFDEAPQYQPYLQILSQTTKQTMSLIRARRRQTYACKEVFDATEKELQMTNSMKPMRAVRGICQSLCIVLLLFTCGVLSAQNQGQRVRNIVLVHGAWADGSGWKGVYEILVKAG